MRMAGHQAGQGLLREMGIGSVPRATSWQGVRGPKRAFGNVETGHRVGDEAHATTGRSNGFGKSGGTFADIRRIVSTLTSGTSEEKKLVLSDTILVLKEDPDTYSLPDLQEMAVYIVRVVQNDEENEAVRRSGIVALLQIVVILEEHPLPCDAGTAKVLSELRKVTEAELKRFIPEGSVATEVRNGGKAADTGL